jgi:hypothetical protein
MLNIKDFAETIVTALKAENTPAEIKVVTKNNGFKLTGVAVGDGSIVPVVYLENYFERYMNGDDIKTITTEIKLLYAESLDNIKKNEALRTDKFKDWNWAKERIILKVVDNNNVEEFCRQNILFREKLNLLLYPAVNMNLGGSQGSFKVSKAHAAWWSVMEDEIFDVALANTEKMAKLKGIRDILFEINPEYTLFMADNDAFNIPMFVVTTSNFSNGAALMFSPAIQKQLHELIGDEVIIIPSSVHDFIAIPNEIQAEGLTDMIKSINATEVRPDEVLSDHPYILRNGKLTIADKEDNE